MIGIIVNSFESTRNNGTALSLSLMTDCAIGLALLIIGGCGICWEFMPSYLAPAMLGGGTIYSLINIFRIGFIIKTCKNNTKVNTKTD